MHLLSAELHVFLPPFMHPLILFPPFNLFLPFLHITSSSLSSIYPLPPFHLFLHFTSPSLSPLPPFPPYHLFLPFLHLTSSSLSPLPPFPSFAFFLPYLHSISSSLNFSFYQVIMLHNQQFINRLYCFFRSKKVVAYLRINYPNHDYIHESRN